MPTQLTPKLLSWASILDEGTREQAQRTAALPWVQPHLALMPDAHLGKGATVGSVIPTEGAIMPAAVGVDIGCGMNAVRTQFTRADLPENLAPLREAIERSIPLSAGKYNTQLSQTAQDAVNELQATPGYEGLREASYLPTNWDLQLGSLGSGNHFIEISLDETDRVWMFLHSGSRGVGNKIAQHHISVAREYAARHFWNLEDPDLSALIEGTVEFDTYIAELNWAQRFAYHNRAEMMHRVSAALGEAAGVEVERVESITCHHNYTNRERHFGRELWVSRKGAISASEGEPGLIPGSMGDASYVVEGLGERASLKSAPHGAGRAHSRTAARKLYTFEQLDEQMSAQGIEYRKTDAFVDEIPQAYKPIDQVMADAAPLVKIRHILRQIVNVKGD